MDPVLRLAFFVTIYLLSVAYALARGGRPERQMATVMGIGVLLSWLATSPLPVRFRGPEFGVATIDVLVLALFVWLTLTTDRLWLMWITAMQAVVVLTHAAMILKPVTLPAYYANTIELWSYPQFGLLAVGTLRYRLQMAPNRSERLVGRVGRALSGRWTDDGRASARQRPASSD